MRDGGAPAIIFQRLTADEPETLKEIAKAWGLPRGRFVEWFTTKHAGLYDAALKVRAAELADEALEIADEQKEAVGKNGESYDPEVPRDKLRVETRLKLVAKLDRDRYGERAAGSLGDAFENLAEALQRISEKKHRALRAAQGEVVDAEVLPERAEADTAGII